MFSVIQRYWLIVGLGLAVISAVLLPLNLLTMQRLHHDEALYATWALQIVSGDDPWLTDTPVDKPPLYLYALAGAVGLLGPTEAATRAPSLVFTGLSVLLTFWLGHRLYNNGVALLAAWLVALSPFVLLFAPTTFTDPMMMALALAGCVAAAYNKAGWAGFFMALAISTKQPAMFFVPLPVGLLLLHSIIPATDNRPPYIFSSARLSRQGLWIYALALVLTLLPALIWDFSRHQPSGFFEQSALNYGGLSLDIPGFGERWQGFVELLYYATASPVLNIIFLTGCPLLLIYGLWQVYRKPATPVKITRGNSLELEGTRGYVDTLRVPKSSCEFPDFHSPLWSQRDCPTLQKTLTDWLLALFIPFFLLAHSLLSFQVWDRYLLGLMPFLALLLARILLLPRSILKDFKADAGTRRQFWPALMYAGLIIWLLGYTLVTPVQDAVHARYPLGSNSHALRGIEQITAYLQGQVGANNTLHHRWLGTHWRFYLWGYPYDLQYWGTPDELTAKAKPGHYLAHPTWQSDTELRLALFEAGLILQEIDRAYAPGGNPSIILYRIEAVAGK